MQHPATLSLSTTGILEASVCLKRYDYHFNQHLVPKPSLIRHPMRRGIWVHACLDAYHSGKPWLDVIEALVNWADANGVDQEKILKARDDTTAIMQGYITYWTAQNEPLIPQLTEQELRWSSHGKEVRATLDMVAKTRDGQTWIVEHKTTTRIPNATWRTVDVQTLLQYVVALANGIKVDGILFNYLYGSPAPVPRIKKDGEFYANTALTTTAQYNGVYAKGDGAGYAVDPAYIEAERSKYVSDAKFYQRWPVLRPKALVMETMRDVDALFDLVTDAAARGRYPRSVHIMNCEYCAYSELCAHEYTLGKEAPLLRAELFDEDTGQREGRIVIPKAFGEIGTLELSTRDEYAEVF